MTNFRRLALVFILALSVTALFVGCKGDTGPMGPQGEKGDTGAQGEKGDPGEGGTTRTVLSGQIPDGDNDYFVEIPGLSETDLPSISVFVQLYEPEWDELPFTWAWEGDENLYLLFASVTTDGVTLYNCTDQSTVAKTGFKYIIVIVQ